MPDKLDPYRRKRSADRTPEPVPAEVSAGDGSSFVIQEHHARALHWDFRLERDGVLVSWAVPKGLPVDPKSNRLAVRTEDHPLEYADFAGEIPEAEYGGGRVTIWDRGTYVTEKWSDREVMVVLDGQRVSGRYVLIRTGAKNWLMHRMDPAPPGYTAAPAQLAPMLAAPGRLTAPESGYVFEPRWSGTRTLARVDGGRLRLSAGDRPALRALGASLGAVAAILDGVLAPDLFHLVDLLYLGGHDTTGLPYEQRRELLKSLELDGPHWRTTPAGDRAAMRAFAREHGLSGLIGKRRDSGYHPGARSPDWVELPLT